MSKQKPSGHVVQIADIKNKVVIRLKISIRPRAIKSCDVNFGDYNNFFRGEIFGWRALYFNAKLVLVLISQLTRREHAVTSIIG